MRVFFGCILAATLSAGCASVDPPSAVGDACQIFEEKPDWWRAAKRTERRWDAPPALVLAIVRQESSFTHDARPPREGGFLFIPGKRPSSAMGYAQALETTWARYEEETGRSGADRDDFADAADFIGWYVDKSREDLRLAPTDARAHYLAYHEGQGGYARGTWRSKRWLIQTADRVEANFRTYSAQLDRCERKLNGSGWWPF